MAGLNMVARCIYLCCATYLHLVITSLQNDLFDIQKVVVNGISIDIQYAMEEAVVKKMFPIIKAIKAQ